jgi:hypothetical protein
MTTVNPDGEIPSLHPSCPFCIPNHKEQGGIYMCIAVTYMDNHSLFAY